jgi:hypothetical protein
MIRDMIPYAARDAHAARLRQGFQTRGDIDTITEDGAILDQNITNVDADAQAHLALGRHGGIGLVQGLLDGYRTVHGIDDTGEFGQDAVAGGARNLASSSDDQIINDGAVSGEGCEGRVLVLVHHATVACHIGSEYGDELAFKWRGFQGGELQQKTYELQQMLTEDAPGAALFPSG